MYLSSRTLKSMNHTCWLLAQMVRMKTSSMSTSLWMSSHSSKSTWKNCLFLTLIRYTLWKPNGEVKRIQCSRVGTFSHINSSTIHSFQSKYSRRPKYNSKLKLMFLTPSCSWSICQGRMQLKLRSQAYYRIRIRDSSFKAMLSWKQCSNLTLIQL